MNPRRLLALPLFFAALYSVSAAGQDVVTVGTVAASGSSVDVPVFIRDVAGTPLGIDRPAGSKIGSYSIKVDYSPAAAVSSVTFTRAGITASLTPKSEFAPSSAGSISLLDTFQESTNAIPFNLNAGAPGDKVAHLVFTLSASATPGSSITLSLDPALTQLTDEGGSAATKESPGGGNLGLVNGAINIPAITLSLTPSPQNVEVHAINGTMNATISAALGSATIVTLSSTNASIATVPPSVTIPAGLTTASFFIQSLAIGQTTIMGTLPPSAGGGTASATLNVTGPGLTLGPLQQNVPLGGTANLSATLSTPQPADTSVTLTSADPTVAIVPATVTITANNSGASFAVNGLKAGTTVVQGRLPQSLGGAAATATVVVSEICVLPDAPVISGPSQANSGTAYDVTWPPVSGATEYLIDESTTATFDSVTTKGVTAASATFTHIVAADTSYFYRVRARNHGGSCDQTSPSSASISVLVKAVVVPAMRILPVVGSAAGAFGAFFRTSVQLYNPKSITITGRIVFHAQGASGSDGDPSLTYALAAGKTMTWDDVLVAMGKSGVGSADLIADLNAALPVSSVRVFNDAGAAGTTGLSEDAIRPEDALLAGDSGAIIAPADVQHFRFNIGVRTLGQGATFNVAVHDKDGVSVKSVDKTFGPTFFSQTSASTLLDGLVLTGGETLTFSVSAGSAVIYGSTTDNTTNDPTMQVVRRF